MQEPGQEPAVFVSIDKGGMFQATNLALMDRLKAKFNGVYQDRNVIVSATHTHVASEGMSHDDLYKIAAGGTSVKTRRSQSKASSKRSSGPIKISALAESTFLVAH